MVLQQARILATQENKVTAYNFALDSNNDIIIGRGASRTDKTDLVMQLVNNRLRTWYGEWELDTTLGVPWGDTLSPRYDLDTLKPIIHRIILTTNGVQRINSLDLVADKTGRLISIQFDVSSIYGGVRGETFYGGS